MCALPLYIARFSDIEEFMETLRQLVARGTPIDPSAQKVISLAVNRKKRSAKKQQELAFNDKTES